MSTLFPCELPPERFYIYLKELGQRKAREIYGFFGPDSILWMLSRESILYLGGLRALLAQLSHPAVAQGVYDHSNFLSDPLGRAYRTFRTVFAIVYGTREEAIRAAYQTYLIHDKVRGIIQDPSSPLGGKPYRANDPEALYWVHATLIEATLFTFELFIRPLTQQEKVQFFEEAKIFLALFGVPEDYGPKSFEDFLVYFDEALHSPLHCFTREGRELARAILLGPQLLRYIPLYKAGNLFIASGTVPEPLRSELQIPSSSLLRRSFSLFTHSLRRFYLKLPVSVREIPQARRAFQRCRVPGFYPKTLGAVGEAT